MAHLRHLVGGEDGLGHGAATSALASLAAASITAWQTDGQIDRDMKTHIISHRIAPRHEQCTSRCSTHDSAIPSPAAAACIDAAVLDIQRAGKTFLFRHVWNMRSIYMHKQSKIRPHNSITVFHNTTLKMKPGCSTWRECWVCGTGTR